MNYVQRLQKTNRELRAEIKRLEGVRDEIVVDRDKLREHFAKRLKWWKKLLEEGKTPNMPWLLYDDALWLRRMKFWFFE